MKTQCNTMCQRERINVKEKLLFSESWRERENNTKKGNINKENERQWHGDG